MVMNEYKELFSQYFMVKSEDVLGYSESTLNKNLLNSSIKLTYQAVFYSVCALAMMHSFKTSCHFQMMGWFNKKFVHEEKVFDKKLSKIYGDVFMLKQKSEYEPKYPADASRAKELLADAMVFIETVRTVINDEQLSK